MNFRDPFDPRDPPEAREHDEDCPLSLGEFADEGDDACLCAALAEVAYDDEMERRVDALRDREDD